MLPCPETDVVTVKFFSVNVAVRVAFALIVRAHVPVPVHPLLHPVNVELVLGVAVNVTLVPETYDDEQLAPQFIPAGDEVIVPLPVPDFVVVKV